MAGFENNIIVAKNMNFDEAGAKPHLAIINAAGKIPIGTGLTQPSPEILGGSLSSPLGTILIGYSSPNITLDIAGGKAAIETIAGDTGTISGNSVTIFANNAANNCGTSVQFINSGTVSTLNVTDSHNNTFIGNGAGVALAVSGASNTALGYLALASMTTTSQNTAVGYQAGFANSSGANNTSIGERALFNVTTGSNNTGLGLQAGTMLSSGSKNTYVGSASGGTSGPQTGSNNTIIGYNTGGNWNGAEDSNIYLGLVLGTTGESNAMRLGITGSGSGQVNKTFVAGVNGITASNQKLVTINSSTDQLGVANFSVVNQTFTGSGTYTPTAGMLYCIVEVVGGGGGGGGASASGAATGSVGGAGGGGGYARKVVSAATIGVSKAVTVGGGGNGGGAGNNAGTTGTTSSLGVIVTASGGIGGVASTAASTIRFTDGSLGGVGSSGDFNANGGAGNASWTGFFTGLFQFNTTGNGGNSIFGGGAPGQSGDGTRTFTGINGTTYGGGGSAGLASGTGGAVAGGNGAAGIVIITEYIIT